MARPRRNVLITKAATDRGYRQAEIASYVGLHYSIISRIVEGRK
jgi:hypothetical protein